MKSPGIFAATRPIAVAGLVFFALGLALPLGAQEAPDARVLAARLDAMQQQLDATQRELREYRDALTELRQQMRVMAAKAGGEAVPGAAPETPAGSREDAASLRQAVTDLREEQSVQQAEIAVHEQAKVETRSRYNLKVGGLMLFNAFKNDGQVDSVDVPELALARTPGASHTSQGASVRQSLVTLDATGPQFWGARTYANVQMDFFGSLSTADYTSTAGQVRMRSASLETAWPTWDVHAGLERLLVAQSSPTSYASIGEPAMAWSGNLWAWVPQLTAEKTFSVSDSRQFQLAAALADIPDPGPLSNSYLRAPTAAESSRFPGQEARLGYRWGAAHESGVGMSGYWSPHDYGASGKVDSWAALADWRIALPARFALSGEAYKGQALGGLGGGAFKDIVRAYDYSGNYTALTKAVGLRDEGGWAQLKLRLNNLFEFNGAFGQDNDSAAQLRAVGASQANAYSALARNRTILSNAIFRPRASFLLSLEYRKLESWPLASPANTAHIFALAAGYEF